MAPSTTFIRGYPKRPPFFAHKYVRLLTKAAVAQQIGPEACWLLTVIAHQEDAIHYRRAVTYYNEQMLPLCGFGGRSRLVTARAKAVAHGFLHYEEGGKAKPGRYWVLVPPEYQDLADSGCDESSETVCRPESGRQPDGNLPNAVPNQDGNRTATGRQPDGKSSTFNPNPNPNPKRESAGADVPSKLMELITGWNRLKAKNVIARGNGARVDPPSKAALAGWNRAMKDREQRALLEDIPALLDAIGRAKFCHGQPWFTVPWLFGENKNGESNLCRLMSGAYNQSQGARNERRTTDVGPGQRHTGTDRAADAF